MDIDLVAVLQQDVEVADALEPVQDRQHRPRIPGVIRDLRLDLALGPWFPPCAWKGVEFAAKVRACITAPKSMGEYSLEVTCSN